MKGSPQSRDHNGTDRHSIEDLADICQAFKSGTEQI